MSRTDPPSPLMLPFDKGLVTLPDRCFWLRAAADPAMMPWRERLICQQSFKPEFDRLGAAGFEVSQTLSGSFAAGLCQLTRHKVETRANIAHAWDLLAPGGLLVISGANAIGAASMEKEVAANLGLEGSLSKHQGRTFWLRKGTDRPDCLDGWLAASAPKPVGDSGLVARAGCFSSDHVDPGSALLAGCLPAEMAGRVADLGAGWGYLAVQALARPAVESVDLFEAEALALEDAATNLAARAPRRAATFNWVDVTKGVEKTAPYDWVISNPPFHEGRKAEPGIGQAFIRTAWQIIRRRGKFMLVANQTLPYEAELRRRFREVTLVAADKGYKVYLASDRREA
jgi:16S rRNA (guanine1207-N2)-methyltransferase